MSITVMKRKDHISNDPLRFASCGRPTPWVHVALMDDDMNEVPDGEPGEICVRGPLLMAGYLFALAYLAAFVTYRVAVACGLG